MTLSAEQLESLYTTMVRIRRFDEKTAELFQAGLVKGTAHSYVGEEAVAAGACASLREGDYIVGTHRGHGHCIAKGVNIREMMAEIYGKSGGACKGKGGSMHIADFSVGMLGANGVVGGGANLALACDYRIASDQASIGQVFHKLGLVPDWGGSFFLPRLVGTSRALELVWSARMVPADEALALGLFDRVVPHPALATETRRLAEQWAAQPAEAVRRAKQAVYLSEVSSLASMLDLEIAQQNELFATPEARQRIGAALSKRSH